MSQGEKTAKQSRSKHTRDKLVTALERLLRQKRFADITAIDIAREAGVSAGSIYRRFENKDGLLQVLYELYRHRLDAAAAQARRAPVNVGGLSLRSALRQIAWQAWTQLVSDAPLLREVYLQARLRSDQLGEGWDRFQTDSLDGIRALLDAYGDEITQPDLDVAGAMIAHHFNTALIDRALFRDAAPDWGLSLDNRAFANQIADFAYGYLTVKPDD